ncbi:hypothetical protein Poly51_33530 [Rubripirellula tenax]|uniref:Uncharacterized protein n=1 Tax=Rubripirellula tenax TaxID=2528015 RepID=A0A5C6F209_9BACT|nr:hypothetical protein Poly51_33530 [Rubripirellula tenax]
MPETHPDNPILNLDESWADIQSILTQIFPLRYNPHMTHQGASLFQNELSRKIQARLACE